MIVEVQALLRKPQLPREYRDAIVSLIKSVLSEEYPERFRVLYDGGAIMKDFTFSVLLSEPDFEPTCIRLRDASVRILLSSRNEMDALYLYNAFLKSRGKSYALADGNALKPERVTAKPMQILRTSPIIIRFLSPLVVRQHVADKPDRYYIYSDDEFSDCLHAVNARLLDDPAHSVKLTPLQPRKTVVDAFGVKIRCSIGTYELDGAPEDLTLLLAGGMGSRRSEGFGMFALARR